MEIRRAPYTFRISLSDWGWSVFGKHDTLGDVSLLETGELPITAEHDVALWSLVDEQVFQRKADAVAAVRGWLKDVGTATPPALEQPRP